ncbi:hypothetical protein LINPERPRIM_LOCUS35597 [Linum perenne]
MPLLRDYYDEEAVKAISCIPIGLLGFDDQWVWPHNTKACAASSVQGSVCVFTDCKVLVDALGKSQSDWPFCCSVTLASVRQIVLERDCDVLFRRREELHEVDWLAKSCCNDVLPGDWHSVLGF